jgi:hypothetical protein
MERLMMYHKLQKFVNHMEYLYMLIQLLEVLFYLLLKCKENIIISLGILEFKELLVLMQMYINMDLVLKEVQY